MADLNSKEHKPNSASVETHPLRASGEGPSTSPLLALGGRTLQINFLTKPNILYFLMFSKWVRGSQNQSAVFTLKIPPGQPGAYSSWCLISITPGRFS